MLRVGDETKDTCGAGRGVCLGDVDIWCGGDTTPSEAAMSLIGMSGAGSTWSAQGVGESRGVVVIEGFPSTHSDFMAEGQGVSEFTCPSAAERGGTEMQELSLSLRVITGYITWVRTILPVEGSSSSFSKVLNSMTAGAETSLTLGKDSQ